MKETVREPSSRWAAELAEMVAQCSRCGKCQSVCPVYDVLRREQAVARGKVALVQRMVQGALKPGLSLHYWIYMCLKCLRCQSICPSSVEFASLQRLARSRVALRQPTPIVARLGASMMLARRWLFDLGLRVFYYGQKLLGYGKLPPQRHVMLFGAGGTAVPKVSRPTTISRYGSNQKAGDRTVAFFTGCLMNYFYTDAAQAAIEVLEKAGWKVIVPKEQLCCGAPLASLGEIRGLKRLARRNIEVFRRTGARHFVTACASCASTLREEYRSVLGAEAEEFCASMYELSQFLDKVGYKPSSGTNRSVTYHDPCHLAWVMDTREAPRKLLRRAADFVEMEDADRCCGMGGIFSTFHPDVAGEIGEIKVRSILAARADAVVTTCPGCMMQIEGQLTRRGADVRVMHLAEVLRETF